VVLLTLACAELVVVVVVVAAATVEVAVTPTVVHVETEATAASARIAPRPLLRLEAEPCIGTAAPNRAERTDAAVWLAQRDHTSAPIPPANATAADEPANLFFF
jgi:hypothetical protein